MTTRIFACFLALTIGSIGAAFAFDPDAGVNEKSEPRTLFKFGFSAYQKGQKDDAAEAYRYAAEKGHPGARWALANMYAAGDGIVEDDYAAFKIYDRIARDGVEPGSSDTGYFVHALVSLAGYYQYGIPESPVTADPAQARQLYFQAASAFGMPEAQFQLGRMMLAGEGGSANIRQAKKWLNRARKSGHPGAAALFGETIFEEGHTVRGLAYMTVALERADISDRPWISSIQEKAFSIADEADRRTAIALAQDMLEGSRN
ncbi:MAG: tetratricopeptide repeat protein [Pseudomonadota bacterium]